jgi:hypothetical protein
MHLFVDLIEMLRMVKERLITMGSAKRLDIKPKVDARTCLVTL